MTRDDWNKYQNEYKKNHYAQLSAQLNPQLVREFKEKLKKDRITFPSFLIKAIKEYLGKE